MMKLDIYVQLKNTLTVAHMTISFYSTFFIVVAYILRQLISSTKTKKGIIYSSKRN